jgi:hypothetical protein
MKIKLAKKNGGWVFLLVLALVFVIVAGVVVVALYKTAKKIDTNKPRQPQWDEVWNEIEQWGSNYAASVGGQLYVIQPEVVTPLGWGLITCSTNGGPWFEYAKTTIYEAENWVMPEPDMALQSCLFNVQVVVTNEAPYNSAQ